MLSVMSFSAESPPAGWYPDPAGSGGERYWDGGTWSQVTRPAGGLSGEYVSSAPQQDSGYGYGAAQQGESPWGQAAHGSPIHSTPVLAGFWWRVLATILDGLILVIPLSVIQGPITARASEILEGWLTIYLESAMAGAVPPPMPDGIVGPFALSAFVSMIVYIAYRTVLVTLKGATFGQMITGLRVVPDGAPVDTKPGWAMSAMRAVTAVVFGQVPILSLVDPLMMLGSQKKQTLHDRIARTVVIKK